MTVEPPTSPDQNSEAAMYSRYWMAYASVPFPRSADDNLGNLSIHGDHRSSSNYRKLISSHDQRLSQPLDYGEKITYSPYPAMAYVASPSSFQSDLMVRSSAHNDPMISSWRPIIGVDYKKDKNCGSPMILFDEHGEMHRNYFPTFTRATEINTNEKLQR